MYQFLRALAFTFIAIDYVSAAQATESLASKAGVHQAAPEVAEKVNGNGGVEAQSAKCTGVTEKLRYCDEFKSWDEMPKEKNGYLFCRARNVWQPFCQTSDEPYERGTKKLKPDCLAPIPMEQKQAISPAESK